MAAEWMRNHVKEKPRWFWCFCFVFFNFHDCNPSANRDGWMHFVLVRAAHGGQSCKWNRSYQILKLKFFAINVQFLPNAFIIHFVEETNGFYHVRFSEISNRVHFISFLKEIKNNSKFICFSKILNATNILEIGQKKTRKRENIVNAINDLDYLVSLRIQIFVWAGVRFWNLE